MSDRKLLIVTHAPSDNTKRMRDALVEGARHRDIERVTTDCLTPFETTADDVLQADAIILGTPENLGYMSGALKDFFDRIYYPCLEKTQAKPFAYYIRAGHDGTGTDRAIKTITTGLRWKLCQDPLICRGEFRQSFLEDCYELGFYMAASLDTGII